VREGWLAEWRLAVQPRYPVGKLGKTAGANDCRVSWDAIDKLWFSDALAHYEIIYICSLLDVTRKNARTIVSESGFGMD